MLSTLNNIKFVVSFTYGKCQDGGIVKSVLKLTIFVEDSKSFMDKWTPVLPIWKDSYSLRKYHTFC